MRAADTNILIRLIARDDASQALAAENFVEAGAWVSVLALAEAVWVLRTVYDLDANGLAETIDMLLSHKSFVLQEREAVVGALQQFRERPSLRFSDCLMLELARSAGHTPLGTFDKNLARLDGTQKL